MHCGNRVAEKWEERERGRERERERERGGRERERDRENGREGDTEMRRGGENMCSMTLSILNVTSSSRFQVEQKGETDGRRDNSSCRE